MTQPQYHAKTQYKRARNTLAFQVLGYQRKQTNQHGTRYSFPDRSWLMVSHTSNYISWGPVNGLTYATRKLWDDRASSKLQEIWE